MFEIFFIEFILLKTLLLCSGVGVGPAFSFFNPLLSLHVESGNLHQHAIFPEIFAPRNFAGKAGAELDQVQDKLGLAEISLVFYYTLLASANSSSFLGNFHVLKWPIFAIQKAAAS